MRRKALALGLAALVWAGSAQAALYTDAPPCKDWTRRPLMRLTAFQTGESDCLLLQCGGENMMIDGGAASWREKLRDALHDLGVESFRYLLNTHYHDDHISGLIWLMRYGFEADEYLHPYGEQALPYSASLRQAVKTAQEAGIPVRQVLHGEQLLLGEAAVTLYRYEDGPNVNARSVTARVDFGNASLLLTADIIGTTQRWYLANLPEIVDVDILKAPHHGITAVVDEFLEAASPLALLVTNTDQRANVAPQARKKELPVYYSGKGRVVMETDGQDWYVYQLAGD